MSTEVRVPTLGESIFEATISKWLKHEGDTVAAGEPLLELETDKVNIEVSAEHSGVLGTITRAEGDTVGVGDVVGVIQEVGDQPPVTDGHTSLQRDTQRTNQQSAHKAPPQPPSQPAPQPVVVATSPQPVPASVAESVHATPLAQRFAAENNIDIQQVQGSGPSGRITKEDVISYMQPVSTPTVTAPGQPEKMAPSLPPPATDQHTGREERRRMSRRRQTIAQRLVEAQRTAAMLTTFNEIDMGAVMDLRKRRKEQFRERHSINLGFMSFFTKAVIGALKAFPLLNAEIQDDEIVIKHYYDIGIAVGTEQGLVVPVLRDADRKSFAQIEQGIGDLATRARDNTLTLTDLQGGTFSITNGGIYGSLMSTPILNTPQVGILGLHKIEERPVAQQGQVVIRPMMYVALSYDHRIVDGSEAVSFLVRIKELIEDPEALLLEG